MTEHEEEMTRVVKEIELQYAELLSKDITPSIMIGTARSIEMLFEFYCGGQPNWVDTKVMFSLEGSDETAVSVFRTTDLEHGVIIIK